MIKSKGYKRIKCKDGFSMSVQASKRNYCEPRLDNAVEYSKVEVGFPSAEESLLWDRRQPYTDMYHRTLSYWCVLSMAASSKANYHQAFLL